MNQGYSVSISNHSRTRMADAGAPRVVGDEPRGAPGFHLPEPAEGDSKTTRGSVIGPKHGADFRMGKRIATARTGSCC